MTTDTHGKDFFLFEALPEDADEPATQRLPRMLLDFNRRDYSCLNQSIDRIVSPRCRKVGRHSLTY